MKYITLIVGLLVMGCGKQEQADTNESTPTTTEKPVKELTLREKVVGTYEVKKDEDTHRAVLLENGIVESYYNGKKQEGEGKWKISKEGEIHLTEPKGNITVLRINKDRSITMIAVIYPDGKREEVPKEHQVPLKKIK